jgi:PAS domain S-box-containing protein
MNEEVNDDWQSELRRRAEALGDYQTMDLSELTAYDLRSLIRELQTYQLELELQNEELRRAQAELERARDRYADLFDFAPVGYLIINQEGNIEEANRTGAILLGVEWGDLTGQRFSLFVAPEDQEVWHLYFRQVYTTEMTQYCEIQLQRRGQGTIHVWLEGRVLEGNTDEEPLLRLAVRDITRRRKAEEALQQAYARLEQRVAERTDELEAANTRLAQEVEERRRAEQELQESRTRLRALFDQALDAILVTNDAAEYVDVNPAACQLLGYTCDELLKMKLWDLMPEEDRPAVQAAWQQFLTQGSQQGERVLVRKDGTRLCTEFRAVAHFSPGLHLAMKRDITERVHAQERLEAALDEKETLLKEVYHRVKNHLQSLNYLIDMQSGAVKAGSARRTLEALQGRVTAMALVHQQLSETQDLERLDLARYLYDLTARLRAALAAARPIRLTVKAADVYAPISVAIPCGLIVNELVTNALEHAFPEEGTDERPEYEVQVTMDRAGGEYVLRVRDNGRGLPAGVDWRTTESLGLRLVEIWATRQLGGTLEVDVEDGTTFTVRFAPEADLS